MSTDARTTPRRRWYRRLEVQLWLWAVMPLTLALVAFTLTGVYSHQRAMHDFVAERDAALAGLYARQIEDGLAHGTIYLDGTGIALTVRDAHIGKRGILYVVDSEGHAVFHPDPAVVGQDLSASPAVQAAMRSISGTVSGRLPDGTETIASFATVGETRWRVIVEEPVADVIVPILRFSSLVPALVAAAVILSVIIVYFSVRTIVRPLQRLADASARITGGEFSGLQLDVGGVEEIRDLQHALRDMVERIRRYQESMRDYIEGITQGQEAERARLSRDLHDQTVQDLIAMTQRLQLAQRALERGDSSAALDALRAARSLAQDALGELRRLIRALRPIYLEDLGFLPALEMLVRETPNPPAELRVSGEARRLRPDVELAAFRIAQEALANAVQHAGASKITLTVSFGKRGITLSVEDDGVGFILPDIPDTLTHRGHFGLVGMRERAALLGGRLEIRSEPGRGTRVTAWFPAE
ncbi:MAG: HAMP domain-containing protein [Chloroflexi bacterium]|nr:HAMP domain-containing protein [Chloroflexota bacterium]